MSMFGTLHSNGHENFLPSSRKGRLGSSRNSVTSAINCINNSFCPLVTIVILIIIIIISQWFYSVNIIDFTKEVMICSFINQRSVPLLALIIISIIIHIIIHICSRCLHFNLFIFFKFQMYQDIVYFTPDLLLAPCQIRGILHLSDTRNTY